MSDVQGRSSEIFDFAGGVVVHPLVFSTALGTNRNVADYQVRQEGKRVAIDVIPQGELDVGTVRSSVEDGLKAAGALAVKVSVRLVDSIPRVGATAKLRRFIPDRSRIEHAEAP